MGENLNLLVSLYSNKVAITEALTKLIVDPELRSELRRAARRRLENTFTWIAVTDQYVDLYK